MKFLWIKVLCTLGRLYTDYIMTISFGYILHSVLICTVVVLYCFVMCVCVGLVMCACFGNMYTVL